MCIAFDGAYILEAPTVDPGIIEAHRPGSTRESPLASADQAVDAPQADRFDRALADHD